MIFRLRTTLALGVVTLVTLVAAGGDPGSAAAQQAQPDPVEGPADWVPFEGSFRIGCTRANPDNPGCEVHHPTWAIDVTMPIGTRIRSAGDGVVVAVTRSCAPLGGDGECNGGAGNLVVVRHGDYWSRYLHLSEVPDRIRVGRPVAAGDVVGRAGASGTFGGVHLHYDEYQPFSPAGRVAFGAMFACHGDEAVLYPDILGYDAWDEVPPGTLIRSDGYDCTGHPAQPHPPAPEPPIYPRGPALGIGGAPSVAVADLRGDGRREIAIGAPGAAVDGVSRAGAVFVVDGTRRSPPTRLAQGSGLSGTLESADRTGAAVVAGDFDCDGRDDLAIGSPGEDLAPPFVDIGAVSVVFGSGGTQGIFAGQGLDSYYMRPSDWVGAALAAGDFNADGCDDLAIASPGADRSAGLDMGLIWVLSGSESGLTRPLKYLQGVGLGGLLESHDQSGYSLAVGDFTCDDIDDLAVGVPRESINAPAVGAVLVAHGSTTGLRGRDVLFQGTGLAGTPRAGEWTGMALAAGDIDGDGCDDLAVGAPGEAVGDKAGAGSVLVTFGDPTGLLASSRRVSLRAGAGLPGPAHAGDRLGSSVAIVDLDGDRRAELVVGAPGVDVGAARNAGAAFAREGGRRGFGPSMWTIRQGRGLPGRASSGAQVGSSVLGALVDTDRIGDLVISAPGTRVSGKNRAGAVFVLHGTATGTGSRRAIRLDQRSIAAGRPAAGTTFGGATPMELLSRALRG